MTDAQGMSQGQDNISAPPANSEPATGTQNAPATPPEGKVFRQDEVNSLVARKKAEAVEEYRRLNAQQPQYAQQKYGDGGQPQNPQGQNPLHEQDIRRLAGEEAQRLRDQWITEARNKSEAENAQRTVQNFWSKIAAGKEKYQDFDKVVPSVEVLSSYPNVVQLLGDHVDNSADIFYQLGQDLTKMELIESMAQRNPRAAIQQMQRMSQSIKDNEAAQSIKSPREPLSQMRPSNTGTDNGVMGVKDYRAKWKV